ncbi:MAG: restriction endonuclease subunit S [Candidatus Thiodiazotropha endolucinida]
MTVSRKYKLGDVCVQDRKSIKLGEFGDLRYIGLESIESNTGEFINGGLSKTPEVPKANSFYFTDRHVLYGKLRPYLNKVALPEFEGKCSTEIIPLLPDDHLNREYFAYFLRSAEIVSRIVGKTTGARMPRADMGYVLSLEIPLPSLPEQRRIVDILKRADGIRRLRKQAQDIARQLIPALFIDMFGDPVANPNGWILKPLKEVADIGSGVTKGRKLEGHQTVELPYLAVSNVQDGHLNLTKVKSIRIKPTEIEKYQVLPGDFLMTEGGDPDKLGRGAIWNGEVNVCLHQNHVFKVRCNREVLLPEYLRSLVGSHYGKGYFLRVAKQTTGIASINKTQLGNFPVLVPPIEFQNDFVEQLNGVQSIVSQQEAAQVGAESSFQSLMHRAFIGVI